MSPSLLLAALVVVAPGDYSWVREPLPGEGQVRGWGEGERGDLWLAQGDRVYRFVDGDWEPHAVPEYVDYEGFVAMGDGEGFVGWFLAPGTTWRWLGGDEWQEFTLPAEAGMGRLVFADRDRGCTHHLWSQLTCFDGERWSILDDPALAAVPKTYPVGVHVDEEQIVFVHENGNAVFDDGTGWKTRASPAGTGETCHGGSWGGHLLMFCVSKEGETREDYLWEGDRFRPLPYEEHLRLGEAAGYPATVPLGIKLEMMDAEAWGLLACPYPETEHMVLGDGTLWARSNGWDLYRRVSRRLPQLIDSTHETGFGGATDTGDVAVADLDGDGLDDLFLSSAERADRLYLSYGGTYHDRSELLGAEAECCPSVMESVDTVDLDGDGKPELVITRREHDSSAPDIAVYERDALGRWEVRPDTGFEGPPPLWADQAEFSFPTFTDLDGDGDLDMYAPRYYGPGRKGGLAARYLNDGYGRFRAEAFADNASGGANSGRSWASFAANLDERPGEELLTIQYYGSGNLLYTHSEGGLADVTRESGIAAGYGPTFQGLAGDLDGDGDLDLMTPASHYLRTYRNDGELAFRDLSGELGDAARGNIHHHRREAALVDLEGDGDLDVVLAAGRPLQAPCGRFPRPKLLINRGGFEFEDVSDLLLDPRWEGFRGVVPIDAHGDGDPDLYFFGPDKDLLLENVTRDTDWVQVNPRCQGPNTGCAGAVLTARYEGREQTYSVPVPYHANRISVPAPGGAPVGLELVLVDGRELPPVRTEAGELVMGDGVGLDGWLDRAKRRLALRWVWGPFEVELAKAALVLAMALFTFTLLRRRVPRATWGNLVVVPGILAFTLVLDVLARGLPAVLGHGLAPVTAALLLASLAATEMGVTAYRRARYVAHFRLLGFLGEGGMGRVYKARDLHDGRTVALKLIKPGMLESESGRERFLREAELCWSVVHDGVVQVYEKGECQAYYAGQVHQTVYLSMEFVPGVTVNQLVALHGGKLALERVLRITARAAKVLGEVHDSGVVHRDIKSSNIMVHGDDRVKLMDFGIAKAETLSSMTETGLLMGTLRYMAPELMKATDATPVSDLYGLGIVLYEMLTGRFPAEDDLAIPQFLHQLMRVDPPPPSQFNPSIPPVVDAAVARAIARDPADRYPDCRELAKALRFVLDELSETERSTQCGVSLMTTDPDRTDGGGGGDD